MTFSSYTSDDLRNIIIRYKECGKADGEDQPGQGEGQRYSLEISQTSGQE